MDNAQPLSSLPLDTDNSMSPDGDRRATSLMIPLENVERVAKKIAAIARKAAAHGLTITLDYDLSQTEVVTGYAIVDNDGTTAPYAREVRFEAVCMTVTGQTPRTNGWDVVAIIRRYAEQGRSQRRTVVIPFYSENPVTLPDHLFAGDVDLHCAHCGKARQRNQVFVLHHATEGVKLVGSECVKEFTGGLDPHTCLSYATLIYRVEIDNTPGPLSMVFPMDVAVAVVLKQIAAEGGIQGAKQRGGMGTIDRAWDILRRNQYDISEAEQAEARRLVQAVRDANPAYLSPSGRNAQNAARNEYCSYRNVWMLAHVVGILEEAKNRQAEAEARRQSEYVGSVGERRDWVVTVERVIDIAVSRYSGYGMDTLHIHLMRDDDGNLLVWKTTSRSLEEGGRYTGKATVKEHTVYRDEKQTSLNRCDFEWA